MKETTYDEAILQKYADELYSEARWIIATTTLKYAFVTFMAIALLSSGLSFMKHPAGNTDPDATLALVLAAIAAIVGLAAGRRKAFLLKLEAQKILCQRRIELNTRSNAKLESMAAIAGK